MSTDLVIRVAGIGLVCPAGTGASTSGQRIAEGEISMSRHRSFFNRNFERQLCCPVEGIDSSADTPTRIAALAGMAMDDLGASTRAMPASFDRVTLLLCQNAEIGAAAEEMDAASSAGLQALSERGAVTGNLDRPETRHGASADFAQILAQLLADEQWHSALVIAADSLLAKQRLSRLDQAKQLFSNSHPWGIIPSEAAAAIYLTRSADPSLPRLCAAATAQEPTGPDDDGPALFQGMSGALNEAMDETAAQSIPVDIERFWGDCGQGRYHASEQAHAVIRAGGLIRRETALQNPCRVMGDCGAAAMAVALGLAVTNPGPGGMTAVVGTAHSSVIRAGVVMAHVPIPREVQKASVSSG